MIRRLPWGLALVACSPAPAIMPEPEEPDAAIEPSAAADPESQLLGYGNAKAGACFTAARTLAAKPAACPNASACVERCRAHDLTSCYDLGVAMQPEAAECAQALWELACKEHDGPSCAEVAEARLAKDAGDARARALLEEACQGGVGKACTRRGLLRLEDPAQTESATAVTELERGCSLGDAPGCMRAADLLGGSGLVPYDPDRAGRMVERACELGASTGCLRLGQGLLYGASGFAYDAARGLTVLTALCDGGEGEDAGEGCFLASQQLAASGAQGARELLVKGCDKGSVNACGSLAVDLYTSAQYADAITISTRIIDRQADNWLPRYTRGMSLFDTGKHREAIADLEVMCDQRPDWVHCELWLFAAQGRSGGDGKVRLEGVFSRVNQQAWPAPVFRFFLGKLNAQQLIAAARDDNPQAKKEQECEAYYYIGQSLLIRGRSADAAAMFKKSVATQITNFVEYSGSKAELSLLKQP